jgi:hypothetical protein
MESTGVKTARQSVINPNVVAATTLSSPRVTPGPAQALEPRSASVGYGMPCAKCRAYYPADMEACPICKTRERMSPGTAGARPASAASAHPRANSHSEEAKLLAEERERLRALKSQIYASQPQVSATTFRCALDQNHNGTVEPAAVCHSCYGEMRQQAGRMETALHMDVKEAAKIVYEAVWADTSDPDKTYYNAAVALLGELRRRAGIEK